MENNTVQFLAFLLDADRRWTAHVLAAEVRVCYKTVLHILHDILGYRKIADGKCRLLLHIPAAAPLSRTQEKTTTFGGTEPHHSS